MRILFVGDSPTVNTGFGVVTKNLVTRWHEMGHEIGVLGVNHYGGPYDPDEFPFPIHPCAPGGVDDIYGVNKLPTLMEKMQPNIVFFLNDPWIIHRYLESFKSKGLNRVTAKYVGYYPTDAGPLKKEWADSMNELDAQVCYSNYAERVILEANENNRPDNLYQVYHGVDTKTFKPMNQQIARARLNIPLDAFVVGMVARNQYRKRFDIMVKGFAEFAKGKNPEKTKLYLHAALDDVGFDLIDLCDQFNILPNLIVTKDLTPAKGVSEQKLNEIYNSFDVNCLISLGDGFGLPVAESMATGCPQLVSDHSCLKELVDGHGGLTVKTSEWILNTSGINTWGGVSDPSHLAAQLEKLYKSKDLRIKLSEDAYNFIRQEKFTWDYAANEFNNIFRKLYHFL